MTTYAVVKIFGTIQGEGARAGTPAVFLRLGGCNMWSGVEAHRMRDANRNGAECPKWCDTDFRPRARMTASEVAIEIAAIGDRPLIVITGGEPLLQVDDDLLMAIKTASPRSLIAIETNGTVRPAITAWERVWITMSPKLPRSQTVLTQCDELKLVYPAHDPADWLTFPTRHRFLQPQAAFENRSPDNEMATARYVQSHTDWRLSLQAHKVLGIP